MKKYRNHFLHLGGLRFPLADDALMTPPEPCGFCVGDLVTFTKNNGVRFPNRTVTGFAPCVAHGRFVYFDNSAWWFPVKPNTLVKQTHQEKEEAHLGY
jgi:hypothetical protein